MANGRTYSFAASNKTPQQIATAVGAMNYFIKVKGGGPVYIGSNTVSPTSGYQLNMNDELHLTLANTDTMYAMSDDNTNAVSVYVLEYAVNF